MLVPFRFKMVALVMLALALSFAAYMSLSSSLLTQDRVAYVYDFNLVKLNSVATAIESRLEHATTFTQMLGKVVDVRMESRSRERIDDVLATMASSLGITSAVVLRPDEGADRFELLHKRGPEAARIIDALELLGWRPSKILTAGTLVGSVIRGSVPIAVAVSGAAGERLVCATFLRFDSSVLGDQRDEHAVRIVDLSGSAVLEHSALSRAPSAHALGKFELGLLASGFPAGVRDWTSDGRDYIVAYRRIAFGTLMLASYISKDVAFASVDALLHRSTALGLALLLLAVGSAVLLVGAATRKIRMLSDATNAVSTGNFSVRVDDSGVVRDEITGLAGSFNTMAAKIGELMRETADKARMEKELETAQLVQQRFFPQAQYRNDTFELVGAHLPASECGGDWWGYAPIGRQLIVAIGDVTGHGVSAALVTASAHSAFALFLKSIEARPRDEVNIQDLMQYFNVAVQAAAQGTATMTFLLSVLDLDSGRLRWSNACHPAPYILRKKGDSSGAQGFESLVTPPTLPLGAGAYYQADVHETRLHPGEPVIWYTDGIYERREIDHEKLSKGDFLRVARPILVADDQVLKDRCDHLMSKVVNFIGEGGGARPDDITLLLGSIPDRAEQVRKAA